MLLSCSFTAAWIRNTIKHVGCCVACTPPLCAPCTGHAAAKLMVKSSECQAARARLQALGMWVRVQAVVEELDEYLPARRSELTSGAAPAASLFALKFLALAHWAYLLSAA